MLNTFGTLFRITTWGESHRKAIVLADHMMMAGKINPDTLVK